MPSPSTYKETKQSFRKSEKTVNWLCVGPHLQVKYYFFRWNFKFFLYLISFLFFFKFLFFFGKTIHHKAKELLAMIFWAVEDFKTISLPCYMLEFTLTSWCGKIRWQSFSLLCRVYNKQGSFSLLQKHEGCVGLQTHKVEVEPLAYH